MFEVRKWVSRRIKGPNWKCWLMFLLVPALQMQSSREMNSSRFRVIKAITYGKSYGFAFNICAFLRLEIWPPYCFLFEVDSGSIIFPQPTWLAFPSSGTATVWWIFMNTPSSKGKQVPNMQGWLAFKWATKKNMLLSMELVVSNRDSHNGIYNKLCNTW